MDRWTDWTVEKAIAEIRDAKIRGNRAARDKERRRRMYALAAMAQDANADPFLVAKIRIVARATGYGPRQAPRRPS